MDSVITKEDGAPLTSEKVVAPHIEEDIVRTFRVPERFAAINKMIVRDLNNARSSGPTFYKYTKARIMEFLNDPYRNEKNIRDAVVYLYGVSPHFRRLVQYFVALSDLVYVVSPARIDTATAKPRLIKKNYNRVLNFMHSLDIKNQGEKILTVCFREDTFYGTIREGADSTIIQQLPSEYCAISSIEDNVCNVSFDFSYFDSHSENLPLYPDEFNTKYNLYLKNRSTMRWIELDSPASFAVKANKDILSYAMPPFSGILREIYDIEDYKALKLTKTELENYALLVMQLGMTDDGEWLMNLDKAKDFWRNLDSVLPEEIGSVLTPMPISKISFERTHAGEIDTIAEAEQNLFTAAGVSSLLFNNEKASANALTLSIKADQSMTYSIVKSIECVINRYLRRQSYGKNFKVTFLDCSPFNRKELGDAYLKAAQYGLPTISYYAASQGMSQADVDCLNFLEDNVLGLKERLTPLKSSATQTTSPDVSDEGGRPKGEIGEITDSAEKAQEGGDE